MSLLQRFSEIGFGQKPKSKSIAQGFTIFGFSSLDYVHICRFYFILTHNLSKCERYKYQHRIIVGAIKSVTSLHWHVCMVIPEPTRSAELVAENHIDHEMKLTGCSTFVNLLTLGEKIGHYNRPNNSFKCKSSVRIFHNWANQNVHWLRDENDSILMMK